MLVPPCDVLQAARPRVSGMPLPALPPLVTTRCSRLVVVNTHLDEDVCAAGGLIARIAERGVPIHVLAVTNSDGASATHRRATTPGGVVRRLANQRLAYERLGARHARHDTLALHGGRVRDHQSDVLAALSEIIGFAPKANGLWVLAPRREDTHPDHAAAGAAAAQACRAYRVRLLEYLPTGWPDGTPVPESARSLVMSPVLNIRKRHAIAATVARDVPGQLASAEIYLVDDVRARPRAVAVRAPGCTRSAARG